MFIDAFIRQFYYGWNTARSCWASTYEIVLLHYNFTNDYRCINLSIEKFEWFLKIYLWDFD